MENCRGCGKAISFAYGEWWDDDTDDNICETLAAGTHLPFVRITLAPTPVVSTLGPVAKWRKSGSGRLVPLSGKRAKERKLVTDN